MLPYFRNVNNSCNDGVGVGRGARRYLSDVVLLLFELAVIIIDLLVKLFAPVDKVSWVDSDLLKALCHHACHNWLEVDVGH